MNTQNVSNGCMYANIANYNNTKPVNDAVVGSNPGQNSILLIPSFGGIPGYDSLTAGAGVRPGCNGYQNLTRAYPNWNNGCSAFTQKACGQQY
jgi:hypothetical protein